MHNINATQLKIDATIIYLLANYKEQNHCKLATNNFPIEKWLIHRF